MKKPQQIAVYNERSWAIDLIGHLKGLANANNRPVKDAGGEQSIRVDGSALFPDVLLFGDKATARILQGWELKMPDTPVDDPEFRNNAQKKAIALGLDSYLLWNVSTADLYTKQGDDTFERTKRWDDLANVTTRAAVVPARKRWEALAEEILGYLNDLFDNGALEGRQFIEAYSSGGITSLILENAGSVSEALAEAEKKSAGLRAQITIWWDRYKAEYGGGDRIATLAQAVIANWIGKLLFANILREQDQRASAVAGIGDDTTPEQALAIFHQLTQQCNFWTIFHESLGLKEIPLRAWSQLKQFNSLLNDLRVGSIDQAQLSSVLEATVQVAVRKLRGQYPTPIELSRLLVHLCLQDLVEDRLIDPCCGSGTIARAALEAKLDAGATPAKASATVYAGDQDPQAILIATFALAKPTMMHMPLRLFQADAFTLGPGTDVEFRNPGDGTAFTEKLGSFQAITSNLPFVAQDGRKQYGAAISQVNAWIGKAPVRLPGRADVAAYLPFSLNPLLTTGGRLGIIITNAWLGTEWGDAFFKLVQRYYRLKSVIASGAGRWFQNSDVVTNILILEKKEAPSEEVGAVNFIVLNHPVEEFADLEAVKLVAAQIEVGHAHQDSMTIRVVQPADMARFRSYGLGGNAQFANCDWVLGLPLVSVKSLFQVSRGERRGMNAMFYPADGHGIEPDYIKPLAKSFTAFKRLVAKPQRVAFSCLRTEEELADLGHTGALAWIDKFKTPENVAKLSQPGKHWYQMEADRLSELVLTINYGDRLFIGRVAPPSFVDQRLVPLDAKEGTDIDLSHALLNTTIGMFFIEGMGFGRGLGALDLNKDRLEKYLHVLDPSKLDVDKVAAIKQAFKPLLERDIMKIPDELESKDRQNFDDVVLNAFGLSIGREEIYDSLRVLYAIRLAATEKPTSN